ncbi:hypothetical protein NFI96_031518 [Prochilodus magdalenae]|nr:hypothetical protein NFI96_031518 [Prochilodus magdalenae]
MSTRTASAREDNHVCVQTKPRKSRSKTSHPPPANQSTRSPVEEISRLREATGQLHREESSSEREEELRWKINQLERDKLKLASKYNQESSLYVSLPSILYVSLPSILYVSLPSILYASLPSTLYVSLPSTLMYSRSVVILWMVIQVSAYEAQLARLRALLERGEAHRQTLEYEVAVVRRDSTVQKTSDEYKIADLLKHNQQLKGLSAELSQRVSDLERALEITRQAREEDQKGLQAELHERDRLLLSSNAESDRLQAEKGRLEVLLQEQNDTLKELKDKMDRVQKDREKTAEELRLRTSELKHSAEREEKMRKEVESAMLRIKSLEENVESERAAHLESKFNSEIIQLRLKDLEAALCVEKKSQAETVSNLELLRQQYGEVEKAYTRERDRAKDAHQKLRQLEKEYLSTKTELIGQLDKEKAASAELIGQLEQERAESVKLSLRLQQQERGQTESHHALSQVQKKLAWVEEAHEGLIQEMEQLLQHYHHLGAPQINSTEEGDKRSPSVLMDVLRRTLQHYHTELKDLLVVVDTLNKESKEKETIISEHRRNIQECEERCACLGEEVERLRVSCAEAAAAADRAQKEHRSVTQRWEEERERHTHTRAQIHTLTQEHERDQQEKLAFLHSLYQQLVAGCVLVAPPQSLLGSFSWVELSAVLQEHVEALTSDLSSANQKLYKPTGRQTRPPEQYLLACNTSTSTRYSWDWIGHVLDGFLDVATSLFRLSYIRELISGLESVCEGKAAALASVCEQLKQREESWIRQRTDLDTHHAQLTSELQARLQDARRKLDQTEESVRVLERGRSDLEQEVTRLQDLLSVCRRDEASLLAACALLAGCVCELYGRVCVLAHQKALLWARVCDRAVLEREVGALLNALGEPQDKGHAEVRGGVWAFRRCVIAVLATLRLRALRQSSRGLFSVTSGAGGSPSVCVKEVRLREGSQGRGREEEEEEERAVRVMKMLRSSELAVLIHSCMQGVQQELDKPEHSSGVLDAAQDSFRKLLERLLSESDPDCWGRCGSVGMLARRLGHGLQRLRTTRRVPSNQYNIKYMVSSLQQHFLVFTQRLHSAEVERRELRLEVSRLKRSSAPTHNKPKDDTHTTCVPVNQFQSVCAELSSALQREQQAQALLHQQATQLQELGLTMELHTGDQLEKDRTLAQAVQSLSEAKAELRRKEQSLRLLGKRLSQSQQEKQQLQQSISSAENALHLAAKKKDCLASYVKSVEGSLRELTDRILSRSSTSREDFTLHLPKTLLDVTGPAWNTGGSEVAACQVGRTQEFILSLFMVETLVGSFLEVYQLACSRMASLEREISSYQSHITALKAELQDACLRENQNYVPVMGSDDPAFPFLEVEVDSGTPPLSDAGVKPKDVPGYLRPLQSGPLRKNKAVKKDSKTLKHSKVPPHHKH